MSVYICSPLFRNRMCDFFVVVVILFNSIHSLCINLFISYIIRILNRHFLQSTLSPEHDCHIIIFCFCFRQRTQKCVSVYIQFLHFYSTGAEGERTHRTQLQLEAFYTWNWMVHVYNTHICIYLIYVQETRNACRRKIEKKKRANVMNWTYRVKIAHRHPTYKCLCYLRFRQSSKPNNKSSSVLSKSISRPAILYICFVYLILWLPPVYSHGAYTH